MLIQLILTIADIILINVGFILSFWIRYGLHFPKSNFEAYKNSFVFLSLIYSSAFFLFKVYKCRFKSSWDLFRKVFSGSFCGTMFSIVFVYAFRVKWQAFPTSVFIISFIVNLILIFKFNQYVLKLFGRIKKKILVIGQGDIRDITIGKAEIEKIDKDSVEKLAEYTDVDEIIVCEIPNQSKMGFLTYLVQKLKIDIIFTPACYLKLLPEKINGDNFSHSLATFISRKREAEEAAMRTFDIIAALIIATLSFPIIVIAAISIKLTSKGPIFYKQERIGKDGEPFILYKFRTMINDAEKELGPVLASENDPRITQAGIFMRKTRVDELPQLINVLKGQMSLVGPRPERPFFVKRHKALMEIRLAVRPGLTGLAQIRNAYDLHPKHKIKYDYLYIQRRSLFLNFYILAKTVPVVLLKKGR